MPNEYSPQTSTQETDSQKMIINQLAQQNQLLAQQNRLLQELVNKTPDKEDIRADFSEQKKHLSSIAKIQKTSYIWNWVEFALIALAILLLFYGMYRIWSYFASLNIMLSQYAERFSSSFGGLQQTLEQIEEFFTKLKDFLHLG